MNTMVRFSSEAVEVQCEQAMAYQLSPFDHKLLRFGGLFHERFLDIRVSKGVIEALNRPCNVGSNRIQSPLIILLALVLTLLTVAIHSVAAYVTLTGGSEWLGRRQTCRRLRVVTWLSLLVVFLLVVHFIEAAIWALAYYGSGALEDFSTATYFSLTSYTTVGYGDIVLNSKSRILGPIEATVGILMLGWSTAIIVHVVQRIRIDASPQS